MAALKKTPVWQDRRKATAWEVYRAAAQTGNRDRNFADLDGATVMKFSQMFPSKYLRADDLNGATVTATIAKIELEEIADDEVKPVLSFQGREKKLVLNKTNGAVLCGASP